LVIGFVVGIAIRAIRSSVQKAAGFDIKDLSPILHADKCYIPALFVAAEGDEFVPPHHSQKIYHKYAGDKNVIIVDGDHNSMRPKFMFDSVSMFLGTTLQIPEEWLLPNGQKYVGMLPWGMGKKKANSLGGLSLDEVLALSLLVRFTRHPTCALACASNGYGYVYGYT
jgi:PhoPQ-activated pathogenicity-related protein